MPRRWYASSTRTPSSATPGATVQQLPNATTVPAPTSPTTAKWAPDRACVRKRAGNALTCPWNRRYLVWPEHRASIWASAGRSRSAARLTVTARTLMAAARRSGSAPE
jgi:hypothetical protein